MIIARPCNHCGSELARLFLMGWRCYDHAPDVQSTPRDKWEAIALAQREPRDTSAHRQRLRRYVEQQHAYPGRSQTSAAAARKVLPKTGTQRRQILDAIVDAYVRGFHGATDVELQRHLRLGANSVRPRRRELVQLGLVLRERSRAQARGQRAHSLGAVPWRAVRARTRDSSCRQRALSGARESVPVTDEGGCAFPSAPALCDPPATARVAPSPRQENRTCRTIHRSTHRAATASLQL